MSRQTRSMAIGRMRGVTALGVLAMAVVTLAAQAGSGWLDGEALPVWQQPGDAVPAPSPGDEATAALAARCGASAAAVSGTAAAALHAAGWAPFLHLDRQIARDDVEIVGGMRSAGPGCEPLRFNLFVFVGGRFAGTVAPAAMAPGRDGVAGAARLTEADTLTVEFSRYTPADPECCASSRVRVTYRIDRSGERPALVPIDRRLLR